MTWIFALSLCSLSFGSDVNSPRERVSNTMNQTLSRSSGALKGYSVKPPNAYHPIEYITIPTVAADNADTSKTAPHRQLDSLPDLIKTDATGAPGTLERGVLESPFQKTHH